MFLLLALPAAAQPQFTTAVNPDGSITLTKYACAAGPVVIPETLNGRSVTSIGDNAFRDCDTLTSVTIPNSVTSIGDLAFSFCTDLTSVTGANRVTSIGRSAFQRCANLTKMTLPNSITRLGDGAFSFCTSLANITIPASLSNIEDRAFVGCTSLVAIAVDPFNSRYSSVDGVLFERNLRTLLACPGAKTGGYAIPDGVATIGTAAFVGCNSLTSVTIPNSVLRIGDGAFAACARLTDIAIPNSIVSIGAEALSWCPSLTNIAIPPGVTSIGDRAFAYCRSLIAITVDPFNSRYASVDGAIFDKNRTRLLTCPGGKTGSYRIPEGVTAIADWALSSCSNLTSVTMPNSVTIIPQAIFMDCTSLGRVAIADGIAGIPDHAFWGCLSLTNVTIPDHVTSIGKWAFAGCKSLNSLRIPPGVTLIPEATFFGCSALATVTIPAAVASIGSGAFVACFSLTTVLFEGNPPALPSGVGDLPFNAPATVYYLPGTSGWGTTYSGRPTEPWPLPTITAQPQDTHVVVAGSATFSVTAGGTPPLAYLWHVNGSPSPWTSSSLRITNVQPSDAGDYSVVVFNSYGAVTSRVATLTVVFPPPIHLVTNLVVVGVLAGSGTIGYADGAGPAAQFNSPNGGCIDAAGSMYVADGDNHRIRKITPDGTVTTIAGTGVAGYADGPAATSQFSYPLGVCVDRAGSLYVADTGNNRVRKISANGTVTTVAGTGVGGYRDGAGATAWLNFPNDLVVDTAGNLFVTEYDNHTVRRIAPDGTVSTWVGNGQSGYAEGPRAGARLTQPGGIALDSEENLYVAEYGGQRVRKVSVSGIVSTLGGTGTAGYVDGEGNRAQFRNPDGIVVDRLGDVYVADNGNHVIRRIRPTGLVETLAGTGTPGRTNGFVPAAQFAHPTGIGLLTNGVCYVTDGGNHQVRWIVMDPRFVVITVHPQNQGVLAGTNVTFSVSASGTPPLRYQWRREGTNLPNATGTSLVLSNVQPAHSGSYSVIVSNLFSSSPSQVAVLTVTSAARHVVASVAVSAWAGTGVAGNEDGPRAQAQFNGPNGGYVDATGNVYVADVNNHRIRRISPNGTVTTLAGRGVGGFADGPADQAQFWYPLGVCVDGAGNVYVADAGNNRVRKISPEGNVTTLAGTGVGGYRDGPGTAAWLNYPNDLVVDDAGNLWVTEYDNHTVRRISPDGEVRTWVGNGQPGYADGPRSVARLTQPGGIAIDPVGNLYVTEYGGQRVRKVTEAELVSTLAGTGVAGYLDGDGSKAQFRNPDGIVVGTLGYLYVADNGNHAIRRISPAGYVETLAGTGEAGYAEGTATAAQFANPSGIGVSANGVLYVTDGSNQRVRRLSPPGLEFYWLGNGLVVNWSAAGWILQASTNIIQVSAWQDVAGRTNGPVIVPIEATGPRFFRLRDASAQGGNALDPRGLDTDSRRALRGGGSFEGAWTGPLDYRLAHRVNVPAVPDARDMEIGFRVLLAPAQP